MIYLKNFIRDIKDFPQKGILFRDITPLLADSFILSYAIDKMTKPFELKQVDFVVAIEARGFIFGPLIANKLNAGFVPIRKKGKLPYKTESISYELEYSEDIIEIHSDSIKLGDKVLIVDDLLATGGTIKAACDLIEKMQGEIVGVNFLIELSELNGRKLIDKYVINSVIVY